MEYFTQDLILRLNSNDEEIVHNADFEWDDKLRQYQKSIDQIRNILSKDLIEFDLHDSTLEYIFLKIG